MRRPRKKKSEGKDKKKKKIIEVYIYTHTRVRRESMPYGNVAYKSIKCLKKKKERKKIIIINKCARVSGFKTVKSYL